MPPNVEGLSFRSKQYIEADLGAGLPHAHGSPANWRASSYCLILDSDSYNQLPAPWTGKSEGTSSLPGCPPPLGDTACKMLVAFLGVLSTLQKCPRHLHVQSPEKEVGQIGFRRHLSNLQSLLHIGVRLSPTPCGCLCFCQPRGGTSSAWLTAHSYVNN